MIDARRAKRIAIVLLAIAVVSFGAGVALTWGGAALQWEANVYGEGLNLDPESGEQYTEEQYRHIESLWQTGSLLFDTMRPMIITALAAGSAALSLLGVRWEQLRRARQLAARAPADVAEPAPAS